MENYLITMGISTILMALKHETTRRKFKNAFLKVARDHRRVSGGEFQRVKNYKDLQRFAESCGFVVTATTGGAHNTGSKHFLGLAIVCPNARQIKRGDRPFPASMRGGRRSRRKNAPDESKSLERRAPASGNYARDFERRLRISEPARLAG